MLSCYVIFMSIVVTNAQIFHGQGHVTNCDYYTTIASEGSSFKIGCVKCKQGYTGLLKNVSFGYGFIKSCQQSTCGDTFVPGLQSTLNSFVSCHTCHGNKIPVLFIKGGATYQTISTLSAYKLDSQTSTWINVNDQEDGQTV